MLEIFFIESDPGTQQDNISRHPETLISSYTVYLTHTHKQRGRERERQKCEKRETEINKSKSRKNLV